ncbi:MAG: tRNA-specific adenosine deaminase [Holosporales bacterium]
MQKAYEQAQKAFLKNEVPVGAVLVQNGKIIASAHNLSEQNNNPLHHAEMLVLEKALCNQKYLTDCDLYVTLEPCCLCAGAIALSRVRRVYFGAYDPKGGFVDHNGRIFETSCHKPEVYGGIMEKICQNILTDFFKTRRL